MREARAQPATAELAALHIIVSAHMGSMEPNEKAQVRLKRHRPARSDLRESTPKEVHAEATLRALSVLTGVLGRDPAFRDHCAGIASGSLTVSDAARLYVRRDWIGRRVLEHLLRVGATRGVAMLAAEAGYAVPADEPLGPGDRRRWVRSNAQHTRGAVLLARLGAGACLKDRCLTHPRGGGPYCNAHEDAARRETAEAAGQAADRRAMQGVLRGAAAGLDLACATRAARTNWSSTRRV